MNAARKLTVRKPHEFVGETLTANWQGIKRIAQIIKERRKFKMMTQERVADVAGIDPSTHSRLEAGEARYPRFATVINVLGALDFTVTIHPKNS